MKWIWTLYIIFYPFLGSTQIQQVDYHIIYQFTYPTDTVGITTSIPEDYILYKVNDESRFLHLDEHFNDSVQTMFKVKNDLPDIPTQEQLDLFMQEAGPILKRHATDLRQMKDLRTNESIVFLYGTWHRQYMKEPLVLDWDMRNERDTIKGLPCHIANTYYGGRKYKAWFTPNIPLMDGPYVFNGLPGLILKIVDDRNWFSFEIKSMNLKPHKMFAKPSFYAEKFLVEIDRQTYVIQSRDKKENPKVMMGMPASIATPEFKLKLKKRYEKRFDLLLEQLN